MFTFAQNWNHILVSKKIYCFKISSSWLQQTYTLRCCWCSRKNSCARILKNTKLYQNILEGDAIPKLNICLEGAGTVLMVPIGDSPFPPHPWLLKSYKEILETHSRNISIKSFVLLVWLLKTPTGCWRGAEEFYTNKQNAGCTT